MCKLARKHWPIPALATILAATIGAAGEGAHWDYEGENGPAHWGELAPEFGLCETGRNQSPIDLVATHDPDLPAIRFDYRGTPILDLLNNGHTIQEAVEPGSWVEVAGRRYELKQFHFHSPSEHRISRKSFPLEVHLVHQHPQGDLAVIGVMVEQGEENPVLRELWPLMPRQPGEHKSSDDRIKTSELLPDGRDYLEYNGSLTTPPCSEGVHWIVFKKPIEASPEQIQRFVDVMGHATNRPVQPVNARIVVE
jgi:carbonic anhydrase